MLDCCMSEPSFYRRVAWVVSLTLAMHLLADARTTMLILTVSPLPAFTRNLPAPTPHLLYIYKPNGVCGPAPSFTYNQSPACGTAPLFTYSQGPACGAAPLFTYSQGPPIIRVPRRYRLQSHSIINILSGGPSRTAHASHASRNRALASGMMKVMKTMCCRPWEHNDKASKRNYPC